MYEKRLRAGARRDRPARAGRGAPREAPRSPRRVVIMIIIIVIIIVMRK